VACRRASLSPEKGSALPRAVYEITPTKLSQIAMIGVCFGGRREKLQGPPEAFCLYFVSSKPFQRVAFPFIGKMSGDRRAR
jgi:hypothetical protein